MFNNQNNPQSASHNQDICQSNCCKALVNSTKLYFYSPQSLNASYLNLMQSKSALWDCSVFLSHDFPVKPHIIAHQLDSPKGFVFLQSLLEHHSEQEKWNASLHSSTSFILSSITVYTKRNYVYIQYSRFGWIYTLVLDLFKLHGLFLHLKKTYYIPFCTILYNPVQS